MDTPSACGIGRTRRFTASFVREGCRPIGLRLSRAAAFTVSGGDGFRWRNPSYALTDHIDALRAAVRHTRQRHPFAIDAMTILPEHLHAVWTLPPNDADFSLRWRLIKSHFTRHMPHGEHRRASRIAKGERGTWQRRYWETRRGLR